MIAVAPPVPGTVVVNATVKAFTYSDQTYNNNVFLSIGHNSSTDCVVDRGYSAHVWMNQNWYPNDQQVFVPLSYVARLEPGLHTFTINGRLPGEYGTAQIKDGSITAVFYPEP